MGSSRERNPLAKFLRKPAWLAGGGLVFAASTLIVIKLLSRTESSLTTTLYVGLFTTPLALIAAIPVWQTPTVVQLGWLALVGALGGLGQLCLAQALRTTDITVILPIDFTKLVWASLLGYALFNESPDVWSWTGGAIIFAAAFYVARNERTTREAPLTQSRDRAARNR